MRYKYQHILNECNRLYIAVTVMDMGHSLYEWNWTSSEFLVGRSRRHSVFNNHLIILQLRKIIGVLTTTFEQMPLQRMVTVNSMPGKMSVNSLYNFDKVLSKLTEFYMLRYLPGTFSNAFVMYNYWYRSLFNRLRNKYSRDWRAFNRTTMIKISWVPDLVLLLGAANESANLAREVDNLLIPSIVLLDSNTAPVGTFYPLRGSDDSTRIFRYLLTLFGTCIGFGKELAFYSFEKYFDMTRPVQLLPETFKNLAARTRKVKGAKKYFENLIKKVQNKLKKAYSRNISRRIKTMARIKRFEKYQKIIHRDFKTKNFVSKFSILANSLLFFSKRKLVLEKIEAVRSIPKNSFISTNKSVHFVTDTQSLIHFTFAVLKQLRAKYKSNKRIKHFYPKNSKKYQNAKRS